MCINLFSCVYYFVPTHGNEGIRETWDRCASDFSVGAYLGDDVRGKGGTAQSAAAASDWR